MSIVAVTVVSSPVCARGGPQTAAAYGPCHSVGPVVQQYGVTMRNAGRRSMSMTHVCRAGAGRRGPWGGASVLSRLQLQSTPAPREAGKRLPNPARNAARYRNVTKLDEPKTSPHSPATARPAQPRSPPHPSPRAAALRVTRPIPHRAPWRSGLSGAPKCPPARGRVVPRYSLHPDAPP